MDTTLIDVMKIRDKIAPKVKIDLDELGVILPGDNDQFPKSIPTPYWSAAGGMYAYIVGKLSLLGVDILGQSQLVGYPTQYPSVALLQWTDGTPNARYWALKILLDYMHVGDIFVKTTCSDESIIFASAFFTKNKNKKRILLVNKHNEEVLVTIPSIVSGKIIYTDSEVGFNPPQTSFFQNSTIQLGSWSVAIVEVVN